jgi:solute carrier family 10 (sodium/bile acid cotransporter), member 7
MPPIPEEKLPEALPPNAPIEAEKSTYDDEEVVISRHVKYWRKFVKFYWEQEFIILIVLAILLAYAYPPLGATYLAPQITATWIAVIYIFLLAGLALKTDEFKEAFQRLYFNVFVQCYNFGVVSALVFGFSRFLVSTSIITQSLADGMVICSTLPLTINMVQLLTRSAGGDEAAAIFHAAFGNIVGVFLSPLLILGYLGVTGSVELGSVFLKLVLRVVLPLIVGQILQKTSPLIVTFVNTNKSYFKSAQQYSLVFIVYTVFCTTFEGGSDSTVGDVFLMVACQLIALVFVMVLAWFLMRLLFRDTPELRVMGLFGCTHKTVAMGVPLINAIYDTNPNVGLYTLPLLIWHSLQLLLGSFLVPRLHRWVQAEKERVDMKKDVDDDNAAINSHDNEEHGASLFAVVEDDLPSSGRTASNSTNSNGPFVDK